MLLLERVTQKIGTLDIGRCFETEFGTTGFPHLKPVQVLSATTPWQSIVSDACKNSIDHVKYQRLNAKNVGHSMFSGQHREITTNALNINLLRVS